MQRLKQLRWSLPPLTSAQVMVMLYINKKRHFISVVLILSLWLYYLYRRLRTGQVPCLLISRPLPSLPSPCDWFSFLFIVLSITSFFFWYFLFCILLTYVETYFQFNTNISFGLVRMEGKGGHISS
jgi:hypothetical protein